MINNVMETQEYLTLEQVEELQGLGIEFDTEFSLVYYDKWQVGNREDFPNECPFVGLQHLMNRLPKEIECDNQFANYYLKIEWNQNERCSMYYDHENMYDKEVKDGSFYVSGNNPLLVALELLKLIAINHPESLMENNN